MYLFQSSGIIGTIICVAAIIALVIAELITAFQEEEKVQRKRILDEFKEAKENKNA